MATAGYALVSPVVARLADRFGPRVVLRPLMLVAAAATAALIGGRDSAVVNWFKEKERSGARLERGHAAV